jgi:hypothetical protein
VLLHGTPRLRVRNPRLGHLPVTRAAVVTQDLQGSAGLRHVTGPGPQRAPRVRGGEQASALLSFLHILNCGRGLLRQQRPGRPAQGRQVISERAVAAVFTSPAEQACGGRDTSGLCEDLLGELDCACSVQDG